MSSYRSSYVPWSSTRGSTYSIDKPSLSNSVDRSSTGSRYGSSYRSPSTTSTPTTSYRSSSATRAEPTTNSASGATSIREKYAGRTSAPTTEKESDKPASRRYGNSTYTSPEAPKTTPTLRFGSTSRFGGQIARSPISEKSPTVFGVSADQEQPKEKTSSQSTTNEKLTVVTRSTSPTPPSNSTYLRSRRADLDKGLQRQTSRPATKPDSTESETQTDEKCFSTKKETSDTRKSESDPAPRSTSTWTSRFSSPYSPSLSSTTSSSSRYTPRSTYSTYSRPTDLPLRSTTLSRTPEKDSHSKFSTPTPTTTTPTSMSPKEGKDLARFGGFSYARPTDLPNLSPVHKAGPTDFTSDSEKCKSVTKHSPLTPEKKIALPGLTPDSPEPAFFNNSPLRSTNDSKLTSPSDNKNRLPPQVPKSDFSKTNKDFRKSVLNMDLSIKNDEAGKQNSLSQSKSMGKLAGSQKLPVAKLKQLVISKTITTSSSSEEESSTESTESSSSSEEDEEDDDDDDDDGDDEATISPNKPALVKTFTKHLPEKMLVTSKTTSHVPVNFSDESSKSCEKPPRPPPSPRLKVMKNDEVKKEEAKATVSRLLGPVSNTAPLKSASSSAEDLSEKSNMNELNRAKSRGNLLLKSGSNSSIKKSPSKSSMNKSPVELNGNTHQNLLTVPDNTNQRYCITKIESGERAWWMQSNSDIPGKGVKEGGDISRSASKSEIGKAETNGDVIRRSASKSGINKSLSRSEMIPKSPEMIPKSPSKSEMLSRSASKAEILAKSRSRSDLSRSKSRSELLNKSPSKANLIRSGSRVDVNGEKSNFKITRIESGERAWWMSSSTDIPAGAEKNEGVSRSNGSPEYAVRKIESGERAWWHQDSGGENTSSGIDPVPKDSSSGDLLEETVSQHERNEIEANMAANQMWKMRRMDSGCLEWWLDSDEERKRKEEKRKAIREKPYIGRFTNVDDLLGSQAPPPCAFRTPRNTSSEESSSEDECFLTADQVRIHEGSPPPRRNIAAGEARPGMIKLDDTALQLYKDGDYGSYLDLEASINEQHEEFEDFQTNRKNSIVLRTQLSVRVHTIIEKLMKSEGKELRRSLFSLKQIFQEDKDLVHEFVQNDGLACLIKVGSDADQNYQHYILRALGQVMLYVDGMNGVIEHPGTIQWLYSLVSSKFRSVVKTALKLLLVFVEYVETNCVLLVKAIRAVDYVHSTKPWSNIMKLLKDYDSADTELLIYATTLINKTLNGLPDQDSYYDQVDALEEQGFESIIRRYMSKQGTDLDLLRQFQIYEAVLQHEDGEDKGTPLKQLDEAIRKTLRNRKCLTATLPYVERRKSRRHSTGTSPSALTLNLSRLQVEPDKTNDDYHNERDVGVTPALRRRRERAERQRSFIKEQREASLRVSVSSTDQSGSEDGGSVQNGTHATQNGDSEEHPVCNGDSTTSPLRRDNTVKDLSQRLASTLNGTDASNMKGLISKAKEGLALAKSQSRGDMLKSPTTETPQIKPEVKKSETELHWEELLANTTRELSLCDLDFRDLASDEDRDVLAPTRCSNGIPPPPPPLCGMPPPAPGPPGPLLAPVPAPPRLTSPVRKQKKTVKLFWKEVREDPLVITKMNSRELIWDELSPVTIDTQKLEHLFESRAKDLITKKQQELNKNKEIIVLDPKRSNAINIGMTKLPPPRSIKTAILKMDSTVMNREGIEKLLCMLPSEEERSKIQDAQAANPDLPLGSAEQFLLTLASITELPARLKLWAFKLDYENCEKEIAEPLMDLKQGMETLKANKTFKAILGTLLSIGIFLNGNEVKGFQIEYLSKVPEVKDTVHKHSLLHHLCHIVMEKFPDSTDLYSEIGAVTRASKVDFDELAANMNKMEQECKSSFDHLKVIAKHDGTTNMKVKISDFLADCAERIIVLTKVHRRVINRYHKFCLWLGIPLHRIQATKPNELCRIVSEFALEYRTTRERVLQQLEKKASHRERNKTRGKMITEVGKFRSQEDRADAELRQLLGNEPTKKDNSLTGSLPWRRTRRDEGRTVLGPLTREDCVNGSLTDADDEILETLVKTATKAPASRSTPRERKRTRNADRKSLRRTLRNGLSEEERKHLAAFIEGY